MTDPAVLTDAELGQINYWIEVGAIPLSALRKPLWRLTAEVERLRLGMNLILEFPENAQEIAGEALGNVEDGAFLGRVVAER